MSDPINILLADSSATIRKVVEIIFSGNEYNLTLVKDGAEALQKAAESRPDLLVVDAVLPDMDGYSFCEQVRNNTELATIPVLLMTGSFEPFDEERAKNCGATDHIVKPFESQQLINKVQELFTNAQKQLAEQTVPVEAKQQQAEPSVFLDDPWAVSGEQQEEEPAKSADEDMACTSCDLATDGEQEAGEDQEESLLDMLEQLQKEADAKAEAETTETINLPVQEEWTPAEDHVDAFNIEVEVEGETKKAADPFQEAAPVTPAESVAPTPAIAKEQLQEALTAISTEVITQLVRDIVPSLAEKLIREEIAKITGNADA